jgi:hypothetical protein
MSNISIIDIIFWGDKMFYKLPFVSLKEMNYIHSKYGTLKLDILQRTDGEFVVITTYRDIFIEGCGNTEVEAIKMTFAKIRQQVKMNGNN